MCDYWSICVVWTSFCFYWPVKIISIDLRLCVFVLPSTWTHVRYTVSLSLSLSPSSWPSVLDIFSAPQILCSVEFRCYLRRNLPTVSTVIVTLRATGDSSEIRNDSRKGLRGKPCISAWGWDVRACSIPERDKKCGHNFKSEKRREAIASKT